jgi:hypothetical protein
MVQKARGGRVTFLLQSCERRSATGGDAAYESQGLPGSATHGLGQDAAEDVKRDGDGQDEAAVHGLRGVVVTPIVAGEA